MQIYGYAPWGYQGDLVRVEVDLRRGIPGMEIVGLPGSAVREARERIRIALKRAGFEFPLERILVNLSPADVPKSGSGFDLPMALALLHASGQWQPEVSSVLAVGELALDGSIRAVPGILAAAQVTLERGIEAFVTAEDGRQEAAAVVGLPLATGTGLASLVHGLATRPPLAPLSDVPPPLEPEKWALKGHPEVVRALELAAAGGHSLLLYGPPGAGKSLAARSLRSLLPPLEPEASLETTRLWSLAGILPNRQGLLAERPFREPHHSASAEGLLGGGRHLVPGEISLAHHGALFLDEAPEFSSRVLQSLREPLERGELTVARAGRSASFPSRFQLVLTANACPCGQLGRVRGVCFCSANDVRRYWDRLGTALLDRIDLRVFVLPEEATTVLESPPWDAEELRARVRRARGRQRSRGQGPREPNAVLAGRRLEDLCGLPFAARQRLGAAASRFDWSSRALHSLLRVARTAADLEGSDSVTETHLDQAIAFRKPRGEEYWER